MKKLLHATYFLIAIWCLSLPGVSGAWATHLQGGQLTYEALGNNRYRVSLVIFRDCGGVVPFSNITPVLNYRSTGCAGGSSMPMVLSGGVEAGNPYCANTPGGPSQCSTSSRTNYEKGTFIATVTLPPAAEWVLSVTENARPPVANINPGTGDMYYEARLYNQHPEGLVLQNTSAQYQALDIPIPFVCYQQERTVTFSATEPDGDSLAYELVTPLLGCNEPVSYKSYTTVGRFIDLTPPGGSPCAAYITNNQGTYSAAYPLPSFNISGSCPLKTATQAFNFNAALGSFTFTPAYHNPALNSAENKYLVVGQVTEYRRVTKANGQRLYYKVGQVRRDMLIVVIDCNNNQQPGPPVGSGFVKSGVKVVNSRDSTFITAYTCNYTEVRFRFEDPNPADILTVTYPELDPSTPTLLKPTYLPSDVATFQLLGNGTKAPAGILRIQPDIAFLGKTYRIPIRIEDNACPNKGIQFRTIVLKIEKGNFAKIVASSATPEICAGSSVSLTASPFRPDSVAGVPARYGYQWEPMAGLPASQLENQTISVTPTVTTRYKVRILGLDFRVGTCSDTASVLVRVQAPIRTRALATQPLICIGASTTITATPTRAGGDAQETFSYRWAAAPGLSSADLAKATISVGPTVTTRYKLTVVGSKATACGPDTTSVLVRVQQRIQPTFAPQQPLTCAGSSTTIAVSSIRPQGDAQESFTYQWAATSGLGSADVTKATVTVSPTVTTRYKLIITGTKATPCTPDTASVVVRVQQRIQPVVIATQPLVCAGNPTRITATATRPQGDAQEVFAYAWAAAPGLSSADQMKAAVTVSPTVTTRYKLTITGDKAPACRPDTASIVIRVAPAIQSRATSSQPLVCSGGSATLTAAATRPNGFAQESFTYRWTAAGGLSSGDVTKAVVKVNPAVTTRYQVTSSSTVCGTDTASVLVRVAAPIVPAFRADSAALAGRSITLPPLVFTFTNQSKENQPNTTARYRWSYQRLLNAKGQPVADTEQEFSTSSTVATKQLDIAGVYRIRLRAGVSIDHAAPCQETVAQLNVRVPDSRLPNVFTPNGDGLNDVFVLSTEPTNSKIQIFNRWGRLVKEYSTYNNDWNGDAQPAGLYYFLLTDTGGSTTKGWVELIR